MASAVMKAWRSAATAFVFSGRQREALDATAAARKKTDIRAEKPVPNLAMPEKSPRSRR
jgi:hypothetical protein